MSSNGLDRLCERLGVAGGYHDIWGREHRVSDSSRRALLAALGHAVHDDASAARVLAHIDARDWRRGLPPVRVVGEDSSDVALRITLPASCCRGALRWRCDLESGAACDGVIAPDACPVLERQALDGVEWVALECAIRRPAEIGYHRLAIEETTGAGEWSARTTLIVTPRRCFLPPALAAGARIWGFSAQLYALRSERNWGIGDFGDLLRLIELAAEAGAGLVGVSPLHALFPHDPCHASPYSPSSRRFLNTLHLDVETIDDFDECEAARQRVAETGFRARLRALRASAQVMYPEVAALKAPVLDALHRHFRAAHLEPSTSRGRAFREFQRREGAALRRHALFEALQAHLHEQDPSLWGWPTWPARYRRADGDAVAEFASRNESAIEAREYLQWQARVQLDRAGRRAHELGLALGLYQDLAVGVDGAGSETWTDPDAFALGAKIGAPPDDFNLDGQDWGLRPWRPEPLRDAAYAPFAATLRASMRAAGALRIDHVMGLARLFWIPDGAAAADGSYLRYPLSDLLGVLALESHRNRCVVIGEDLGTVPDEVRAGMERVDALSYRVLYFSKNADGAFTAPQAHPERALICASTHDLPTLAGYWAGTDLELRRELGLFPEPSMYASQTVARAEDRARLLRALADQSLLPPQTALEPSDAPELTTELSVAIHRFLARSRAQLLVVQLDDLLGQRAQVNLPGTTDAYPSWKLKLPCTIETWREQPQFVALLAALRDERGSASALTRSGVGA